MSMVIEVSSNKIVCITFVVSSEKASNESNISLFSISTIPKFSSNRKSIILSFSENHKKNNKLKPHIEETK